MKRILSNWLPAILWAVIIFLFSANPDPYRFLPAAWRSAVPLPSLTDSSAAELLGQLLHFFEYAVLALLIACALAKTSPNSTKFTLMVVLLAMAYALSDEIHQLFVPGRAFQVIDLIIDFFGILAGIWLWNKFRKREKALSS